MKTSTRALILFVPLAAALSSVAVVATRRPARREPAAAPDTIVAAARPPTFLAAAPGRRRDLPARDWRSGVERTYQVHLQTRIRSHGQLTAEQVLNAEWHLTVLGRHGTSARVQAWLTGVRVTGRGLSGSVDERALERPVLVDFAADGGLVATQVGRDLGRPTADLARALAASFQLVGGAGDGWQTHERDATGAYTARYEWDGATGRLTKKKAGYEPPVELVQSDGGGTIDEGGWPTTLASDDAVRVTLADGTVLDAEISVQHRLLRMAVKAAPPLPAELSATAPAPSPSNQTWDRAEADRARMEGKRGADVLRSLAAGPAPAKVPALMADLQAALRLDPSLIASVREAVAGAASTGAAQALIAALGGVGRPPAVEALAALARAPDLDPERRQDVLAGLGLAEGDAPSARETLQELARSGDAATRSTALLALGNRARRSESGDQQVDELLARWRDAQTADERTLALQALGNSGNARILPAVEEGLAAVEATVRGAAVVALRFLRTPEVVDLLGQVLSGDADPWVRAQVPFAARTQPRQALLPALARGLREDRAAEVRLAILQLLGRGPLDDGTRGLLGWSAVNDPDPNVQRAARERLGS
jgi:hypothetical protein